MKDSPTLDRREVLRLLSSMPLVAGTVATGFGALLTKSSQAQESIAGEAPEWAGALSQYITTSQQAPLPEEVRELARRHILDSLAAAVACRDLAPAVLARKYTAVQSGGAKVATILATNEKRSLLDAIFASGMTVHGAEINDFCPSAFTQPGASIIPVTMGIGEVNKISGEEILRAVVVGYEITCRLPKALGIGNMRRATLANHSVGPTFGSAAAAASLLRLKAEQIPDLLSYCVQQASGSWHWLRDIEHVEKAFVFGGMPARRGAECALMVDAGFTGIDNVFEGSPGWLASSIFTSPDSDFDANYLTEKLGERFELPLVGYKRYPVGGPTQPVIDLMLGFVKELPRDKIRHVRIEMPGRTGAFSGAEMPALNLRYLCSIIIADGKLDFIAAQSRERFLTDTAINAFMNNVEVIHDPAQEAVPRVESARVILTMNDGTKHERFLDHVKGFPAHPFDRQDVEDKALELVGPQLGKAKAQQLCATAWQLEKVKDVRELITMIAS